MTGEDFDRDAILGVNFVQSGFFLNRIKEFERKYGMDWEQFMAQYCAGGLPQKCENTDYEEWAFLCNNFMAELLKPAEAGPPLDESSPKHEKPEADSGFLVFWEHCVRREALFRSCSRGVSK